MNLRDAARCQHRAAQSERERENRVLPLDHLQRDACVFQEWHRVLYRSRFSVALGADQGHESAALKNSYSDFAILFAHQLKLLRLSWSDWNHHPPVFGELIEQASR